MPQKNSRKQYGSGGHYHIYNRGVEKRLIFQDEVDYKTFISYMKQYLSPPNLKGLALKDDTGSTISPSHIPNNYFGDIKLLAYCLMPNHIHLLVRQLQGGGISKFMRKIGAGYGLYWNQKYERRGRLFDGRYKIVLADFLLIKKISFLLIIIEKMFIGAKNIANKIVQNIL